VEQPGLEARAALETFDAPHDRQPGVLHHFLGDRPARHDRPREPQQAWLIEVYQLDERSLVPGLEAMHEVSLVPHGRAG
jgi:hypothetical protein